MIALPHCHGETELNSYYSIAMENSGGSRHHKRVVPKKLTSPKGGVFSRAEREIVGLRPLLVQSPPLSKWHALAYCVILLTMQFCNAIS